MKPSSKPSERLNLRRIENFTGGLDDLISPSSLRDPMICKEWYLALENIKREVFNKALKEFNTDLDDWMHKHLNHKEMTNAEFNMQFGRVIISDSVPEVISNQFIDRCREDVQKEIRKGLVEIKDQFLYHSIMDHCEGLDEGPMYTFKISKFRAIHIWFVNEMVWIEVEGAVHERSSHEELTKIYLTIDSKIEEVILGEEEELPKPRTKLKPVMGEGSDEEEVDEDETLESKNAPPHIRELVREINNLYPTDTLNLTKDLHFACYLIMHQCEMNAKVSYGTDIIAPGPGSGRKPITSDRVSKRIG